MKKKYSCGVISPVAILLSLRGHAIEKVGGVHGSKKGKKGYDRSRDKRGAEKDW